MSNERKFYVLCSSNCKFEGMTKEQILAAIEQAVSTGEIKDVDTGFITTIKEQNNGTGLKFWVGKQTEYNAIEKKEQNCFYIITDDTFGDDISAAVLEMQKEIEVISKNTAIESLEHTGCFYRVINGATEWLNPPMLKGVEYRTTERDGQRPVYVKKLQFTTAPENNFTDVEIVNSKYQQEIAVIDIRGILHNGETATDIMLPAYEGNQIAATLKVINVEDDEHYYWCLRQTTHLQAASQQTAQVIVKYTKQ